MQRQAPFVVRTVKGNVMWQGNGFAFDRQIISRVVAPSPGVYLLWNSQQWIYVGESYDLQAQLLAHLDGVDSHIAQRLPQAFGFELHFVHERRIARCNELVHELNPICNVSHPTVPRWPIGVRGIRRRYAS